MSESQGYKLGMKMGLTNKSALFAKIRREGSKREVELLMGSGPANTAFRRGLKSAAFELSRGKRRPAARQKTTRQRLTTAKRPAAKRKSSKRKSSRPKYFSEKQVEAWYKKVPLKVGRYEAYDSTTEYTTKEDMTSEERKDISVWYEIPGTDGAWILSQEYRDSPFVLSANDASEQFSGTLTQMKKKLAAISRRKRKNPDHSRINSDTHATVDGIEVSRVPDSPEKGVTEYYLIDFRGSIEETGPGGLWYDGAFAHRVPGGFLVVDGLAIHKFYKRLPTAAQVAKLIGENYSGVTEDAYLIPKSGVIQFARYKNSKHFV
jgi:hypothetical protein